VLRRLLPPSFFFFLYFFFFFYFFFFCFFLFLSFLSFALPARVARALVFIIIKGAAQSAPVYAARALLRSIAP
jgi:hypothetical protein